MTPKKSPKKADHQYVLTIFVRGPVPVARVSAPDAKSLRALVSQAAQNGGYWIPVKGDKADESDFWPMSAIDRFQIRREDTE